MLVNQTVLRLAIAIVVVLTAQMAIARPYDARKLAEAPPSDEVVVQFVLRTPKEDQLERLALAAANPSSPRYGRYLSMEEVLETFGPEPGAAEQVIDYLEQQELEARLDAMKLYVEARMPVQQAESLADVTLYQYETLDGRQRFLAPESTPQIPAKLVPYVDAIVGLDQTPVLLPDPPASEVVIDGAHFKQGAQTSSDLEQASDPDHYNSALANDGTPAGCPEGISGGGRNPYTPNQWLHAYGLDQFHALGFDGRGERLALIEIDGFLQSDLDGFTDCFGLPRQTPSLTTVPGGPPLPGGGETILDLQVLAATAPGLEALQVFESTDGQGGPAADQTSLARTLLAALDQPADQRPTIISISLGGCEAENPLTESILAERALLRATATGISVFVASGDTGITSCRYEQDLGEQTLTNAYGIVSASYPATSPWVTAVGGTNLWLNPDNSIHIEIVWNSWSIFAELTLFGQTIDAIEMGAGTGGLSAWFSQPDWQRKTEIPNDAYGPYEQARAVPDIALLADDAPGYTYLRNGEWANVGGTSAAAPLMAGAVALMNQALLANDKWRLGFLNPLLYQFGNNEQIRGQVYHDVIEGDNETTWQVFPWGAQPPSFSAEAKPGYDLATGWGSPRFPEFFEQAQRIDPSRNLLLMQPGSWRYSLFAR
ncbi:MAG: hypothetical protein C1943_08815 [Halochromatium sp.]|nr:hypothetical protein [Halochromatium sp.]